MCRWLGTASDSARIRFLADTPGAEFTQDISDVEQVVCRQVANEIVAGRRVPQAMYEDIVKLLPPGGKSLTSPSSLHFTWRWER